MEDASHIEFDQWPERVWRRKTPCVRLGIRATAIIVETITGFGDVHDVTELTEGKTNTNLRLDLASGRRFVLRLYEDTDNGPARERAVDEQVTPEIAVAPLLGAIDDPDAQLPPFVADELDGRSVGLFDWIDGHNPLDVLRRRDDTTGRDVAELLGSTLARLSDIKRYDSPGLLDDHLNLRRQFASHRTAFVDFVDWSLTTGGAGDLLDGKLVDDLMRLVDHNATLLDELDGDARLVHGDYTFDNFIIESDGNTWSVAALLDWEFVRASTPMFDAARILRHADVWSFDFVDAFRTGYTNGGGSLPRRWHDISRLLDIQHLLGMLNGSSKRHPTIEAVQRLLHRRLDSPDLSSFPGI